MNNWRPRREQKSRDDSARCCCSTTTNPSPIPRFWRSCGPRWR